VPPIFQPEVAARAIVWAADHRRREVYVGLPTVIAVVGNKVAPSVGDRYLARTGFDAQQTAEPIEPGRQDNLWSAVAGDHGAHGTFDERAYGFSPQFWVSTHRGAIAAVAGGVGAVLLGLALPRLSIWR
jgi:hypothetical protein